MNFDVRVDGRPVPLRLEGGEAGAWMVNGRAVSAIEVEPGIYSILLDGRSVEARIERRRDALVVHIGPRRLVVEVSDPRRRARGRSGLRGEGRLSIAAPMPGKVVRVLVAEGDTVTAGQGLIVVEAIKMHNEMKAPQPGRIAALPAREGATVAAGEVLAVIE